MKSQVDSPKKRTGNPASKSTPGSGAKPPTGSKSDNGGKANATTKFKASAMLVLLRHATARARSILANPNRLQDLANEVSSRILDKEKKSGVAASMADPLALLVRLVRAYAVGEYRDVSLTTMLMVVATLVYFVMPIDLIVDVLVVIGFTDDIAILIYVVKQLIDELQRFAEWEQTQVSAPHAPGQAPHAPVRASQVELLRPAENSAGNDTYTAEPPLAEIKTVLETKEAAQTIVSTANRLIAMQRERAQLSDVEQKRLSTQLTLSEFAGLADEEVYPLLAAATPA